MCGRVSVWGDGVSVWVSVCVCVCVCVCVSVCMGCDGVSVCG